MFADEFRDPEALEDLKVNSVAEDPEAFYRELKALKGKGNERKIAHLLEERKDLKRRISSAHDALQAERVKNERLGKENDQLRKKLIALRQSKTMRLGKAIAAPAKYANKAMSDPSDFASDVARSARKAGRRLGKAATSNLRMMQRGSRDSEPSKESSTSRGFEANSASGVTPKHTGVESTLNRLWFGEGHISAAADFVLENYDAFENASEKGKSLAQRVLGANRIRENGIVLPARTDQCAYVAEPSRVMYCVNQTPIFNSNGYSTRTRGVVEGLAGVGLDPVVVARSGYPWDSKADRNKPGQRRYERVLNGNVYVHTPGGNLNRDPLDEYFQVAADAFVREAKLNRPSLIQSASNFRTALPALIAARRVGIPFVYEVRGLWELTEASAKPGFHGTERFQLMRDLETLVAKEADHVLAITSQVADELVDRGVPRERIAIAPNAVDTKRFLPLPEDTHYKKSKGIQPSVPVIGFAGSLVQYEGLDLLIKASERLGADGIDHRVVIAGSGASEKDLRKLAAASPNARVRFLGRLAQSEIPRLMSTFDIVACPRHSQLITELVSPLKPLESFSSGIATILSDVAPNVDLAGPADAPRAALFEAGNVDSLVEELRVLIVDPEKRGELGRSARLWALENRTWQSVAAGMISAHEEARRSLSRTAKACRKTTQLKVAVIADEFTRTTLRGSFDVTLLKRQGWEDQFDEEKFDLVFVESAWEGNGGEWHRGVGYYSDDESAELRSILMLARDRDIPSMFWNKEDPVHFARFAPNAALFDHVFTTDANMIPRYASIEGSRIKTIAALPFYAQPEIHNPLPGSRTFEKTFAYAGTYYGERYADRSKGLDKLLQTAQKRGLAIYDRQAGNPDSPYKFPARYESDVRGSLPYEEVIASYSSHLAQLNVSSVTNSPTMFSRRVIEIPACGGIVLSSPGRGIAETLGSNIPASDNVDDIDAWMLEWASSPEGRLDEIWRQMRTIYRSHTTITELAIACRTAGIPVEGMTLPSYSVEVNGDVDGVLDSVLLQSVRPTSISGELSEQQKQRIIDAGIRLTSADNSGTDYSALVSECLPRTYFEDLLLCSLFGDWDAIVPLASADFDNATGVVREIDPSSVEPKSLRRRGVSSPMRVLGVHLPPTRMVEDGRDGHELVRSLKPGAKIIVAGHDLKFAGSLIDELQANGFEVLIDKWESHTKHDEERSLAILGQADAVFCEWGLGNAVWYSNHVEPHQKLVVRVHSQELFRPYLKQIATSSVDKFIFVGELIRSAAVISHGVPRAKTIVIPNPVDTDALALPKTKEAEFGIGFVGIVPRSKRLDRALDVLEELQKTDTRFHLRIKGKTPEDYPWMANRPDEMEFYRTQYKRIEDMNQKRPGSVIFDGYGEDMADWYRNVGFVISTSDFESFHLTLADGAASEATSGSIAWPGADLIYPIDWLAATPKGVAELLLNRQSAKKQDRDFVIEHFDQAAVLNDLVEAITTD